MIVKIILIALCGILWRLGGWGRESGNPLPWKGWRVVLIPVILGAAIGLFMEDLWYVRLLVGLASAASLNIIRIGYGNYDPEHDNNPSLLAKIAHDRNGWWIRAIAGALYVLAGYLPYAFYSGRWGFYFVWTVVSAVTGFCASRFRLKAKIADFLIGSTIAEILLTVR